VSNHNPHNANDLNNIKNLTSKKILCKNFIIFILFLNFFKFSQLSVFIKPNFKKKFMILNAPYRYKLSKSTFYFSRYNILLVIKINYNLNVNSINSLLILYKNLFLFFQKFNINLCHQDYLKIFFKTTFKNNFLISNYK
jgi:hypothetical protein